MPQHPEGQELKPTGGRKGLMRAVLLGIAAVLACSRLTVLTGSIGLFVGVVIGGVTAPSSKLGRLRPPIAVLAGMMSITIGWLLSREFVGSTLAGRLLGPIALLHFGELLFWVACGLGAAFVVRWISIHYRGGVVGELVWIGGSSLIVLAGHRDGMVHRPYAIGDWAWTRGLDPAVVFLALGGLAVFVAAIFLFGGRHRSTFHLSLVLVMIIALVFGVRWIGPPAPGTSADLGLSGKPEDSGDRTNDDELEFRDQYSPDRNNSPVAVVLLHDDYSPITGVYYFRQTAFSHYNGRRLVKSSLASADDDLVEHFPSGDVTIATAPPLSTQRAAVDTTTGLMVEHIRPFALDSPASLGTARNPNPFRFQRAYTVRSHVQTTPYPDLLGHLAGDPQWDDELWKLYTERPEDRRYLELAEMLTASLRPELAEDPLARAFSIKAFLDTNGIYSLRSSHTGSADPAASFLFGDLTGYCVHFAHAAAYLYRSLGIPARVASGYAIPEGSRAGGSAILIRGSNAHAWPEIYLRDVGWVVVDPAPQTTLDRPLAAADPNLQRLLGEMLREGARQQPLDRTLRQEWPSLAQVTTWIATLVAVGWISALSIKVYRLLAPNLWSAVDTRNRLTFRAVLDRFAEVGLRRRFGEPREHFARRVAARSRVFAELTERHLATNLGRSEASLESWSALAATIQLELRTTTPFWRRLIGRLNPISWTGVH